MVRALRDEKRKKRSLLKPLEVGQAVLSILLFAIRVQPAHCSLFLGLIRRPLPPYLRAPSAQRRVSVPCIATEYPGREPDLPRRWVELAWSSVETLIVDNVCAVYAGWRYPVRKGQGVCGFLFISQRQAIQPAGYDEGGCASRAGGDQVSGCDAHLWGKGATRIAVKDIRVWPQSNYWNRLGALKASMSVGSPRPEDAAT